MRRAILLGMALSIAPLWGQATYGGPSILSRGPVGDVGARSDLLVIRPSLQLLGSYESGLYLPSLDSRGRTEGTAGSYGAAAIASLGGYHRWKRTILGLSYQGNFRHYTRNPYMDGIDQMLSLNLQHQSSARTTFSVSGAGGTYSRGYGWGSMGSTNLNYGDYSQGWDPTLSMVPQLDLLDSRTYYAAAGADMIHQRSARLSYRLGGTAFAVRRRTRGLVELNGYTARGDMAYRVSRNSTLGVDYSFNTFQFVRSFGASDFHIMALNYSVRLDRFWTLSLRGGGYRLENLRAVRVQLDPLVAAILGQTAGVEAFYGINYGTIYGVNLARNFRRAGLSFHYDRGLNPGNGIFLTSRHDSAGVTYSYQGWQRLGLSFGGGWSRYATTFQDYGAYKSYNAGVSASYRVGRYVHLVTHAGWRSYDLRGGATSLSNRDSYLLSIGLGFTPREVPLSFQ